MQNHVHARKFGWIWPVLIAALIFIASSRSQVAEPGVPGSDKIAHFSVYALLGTLIVRLGRGWRAAALALLIVAAYGASDEWHQHYTPGRSVELADWLADTCGGAVGIAFYAFWPRYRALLELPILRQRRVENLAAVANVSSR